MSQPRKRKRKRKRKVKRDSLECPKDSEEGPSRPHPGESSETQDCPRLADFLRQKKIRFLNTFLGEEKVINDIIVNLDHQTEVGGGLWYRTKVTSIKVLRWAQRNNINYQWIEGDIYEFWVHEAPEDYGVMSCESFVASTSPQLVKFSECCICMSKKASLLMAPCGHVIFCQECYGCRRHDTCPFCRAAILSVHEFDPAIYSQRNAAPRAGVPPDRVPLVPYLDSEALDSFDWSDFV